MGGLTGSLHTSIRSLRSFDEALAVVQNNIFNIATPGYARQRVTLAPVIVPRESAQVGLGVEVAAINELRDRFLDFQVLDSRQASALFEKEVQILQRIEPSFPLTGEDSIGARIDDLFASFARLSTNASDFNLRADVLRSAGQLAAAFRANEEALTTIRQQLETEARSTVVNINTRVAQIADLIANRDNARGEPNFTTATRLNQALNELSELINFSVLEQSDGTFTLTMDGSPLLVGVTQFPLSVTTSAQQLRILGVNGRDVTANIQARGGQLGAILEARNQTLPRFQNQVNRLAKSLADEVNGQLARGRDLTAAPGQALLQYATSFFLGAGRTAGTVGDDTPALPVNVSVDFSNGVIATISADLDSFFVAAVPPAGPAAGNTVSVTFTSADGSIVRTITTDPLLGGATPAETTAEIRDRLNDQIALTPSLAGLVQFSVSGDGELKIVLSENAQQGFSFSASTSDLAFSTGLEGGGTLGGHSAEEIAAALNAALQAEAAVNPGLAAANIRFAAFGGELRVDGDLGFDFIVTDTPGATGFASGLDDGMSHRAGGAAAAATLRVANLGLAEIAAGSATSPAGNENALALASLAQATSLDGFTFNEFYVGILTDVGNEGLTAELDFGAKQRLLETAVALREELSGVDLNEEAITLLQFQRAFQGMLRIIQVVDSLTVEVLGLVR